MASLVTNMNDAYHCRILKEAKEEFREYLTEVRFSEPRYRVLRNVDARDHTVAGMRQALVDAFDHPVLVQKCFERLVHWLHPDSATTIVDLGSNGFMPSCVRDLQASLGLIET